MASWSDQPFVLLRTTLPDEDTARQVARRLVEARLACCCHVDATLSMYDWEGAMQQEREWVVEARVPEQLRPVALQAMHDDHPYDVPMIETIGPVRVSRDYAQWAATVTGH